jgi:hypothetical protein
MVYLGIEKKELISMDLIFRDAEQPVLLPKMNRLSLSMYVAAKYSPYSCDTCANL